MFFTVLISIFALMYAEFKLDSFVFQWLESQSSGLTAFLLIGLSFFFMAAAGARLMLYQGQSYLNKLKTPGQGLSIPKPNILIFVAGVLFIIPGYLSDAAAVLCLFPPTAWVIRKLFARWLMKVSESGRMQFYSNIGNQGRSPYQSTPGAQQIAEDTQIIDVEVIKS
jgi:UPF0716 family protein affecting phage T7 exclusion